MLALFSKILKTIIASESTENKRFRLPHCRLTLPHQVTPAIIRITLIYQKLKSFGYILA